MHNISRPGIWQAHVRCLCRLRRTGPQDLMTSGGCRQSFFQCLCRLKDDFVYSAQLLGLTPDTVFLRHGGFVFHEYVASRSARADRTWNLDIISWSSIWPRSVSRCRLRSTRFGLSGRWLPEKVSVFCGSKADTVHTSVHGRLVNSHIFHREVDSGS